MGGADRRLVCVCLVPSLPTHPLPVLDQSLPGRPYPACTATDWFRWKVRSRRRPTTWGSESVSLWQLPEFGPESPFDIKLAILKHVLCPSPAWHSASDQAVTVGCRCRASRPPAVRRPALHHQTGPELSSQVVPIQPGELINWNLGAQVQLYTGMCLSGALSAALTENWWLHTADFAFQKLGSGIRLHCLVCWKKQTRFEFEVRNILMQSCNNLNARVRFHTLSTRLRWRKPGGFIAWERASVLGLCSLCCFWMGWLAFWLVFLEPKDNFDGVKHILCQLI